MTDPAILIFMALTVIALCAVWGRMETVLREVRSWSESGEEFRTHSGTLALRLEDALAFAVGRGATEEQLFEIYAVWKQIDSEAQ